MQAKHQQEKEALVKRIESAGHEQEKARRIAQQQMLQRFLNAKNELVLEQQLEESKLNN